MIIQYEHIRGMSSYIPIPHQVCRQRPAALYYLFSNAIFVGHYHVIWTDYNSSALLYECYRVEADQRCSPGADHITMLSRTHNMSQTVYDMMTLKAEQLCLSSHKAIEMRQLKKMELGI